jgi:hypothetical protein
METIKLRPANYRLKLAVANEKGKIGSMEQTLMVRSMPESGLAASSLVLAGRVTPQPDLIQNLQTRLLNDSDPLVFGGFQVLPSVDNTWPVNVPVLAFYKVYNLSGNPDQRKLVAKVRLLGETGETQEFPPFPLDQSVSVASKTEVSIGVKLPFDRVAPGKYKMVIETLEATSNQSVTVQTDLQFK